MYSMAHYLGTFKYVLIEAMGTKGPMHLVRGVLGASYHVDAATPTLNQLLVRSECGPVLLYTAVWLKPSSAHVNGPDGMG